MRVRTPQNRVEDVGPGRAGGRRLPPPPPAPSDDEWVSLKAVLGTTKVPQPVIDLLDDVVLRMLKAGDLTEKNRWQALEYLAADWLAGQEDE